MDRLFELGRLLPVPDWLALVTLFAGWTFYAVFARRRASVQPSILGSSNRWRRRWMLQSTHREVRVLDGVVVQHMSSSASFFASTTILIIGGLLAVLGTTEKASDLVRELPFAARTSLLVFDMKVAVLAAVFVYAFFRFTWSIRLYSMGALLVASAPERDAITDEAERQAFADRAGRLMGMAAESFNDGLRAYYLSFAAVSWFFSPWAMVVATVGVLVVLYRREFRSEVVKVLESG
ncbi:MAG: DUF599 domain-containing protein [Burkholderiales bacterium]|nr:DUF599 domain-containing protein [Burkholderiales bacterium]